MLEEHAAELPVELDSAGTGEWHIGEAPDRRAREAASRRGVEISDLRAEAEISDVSLTRPTTSLALPASKAW